MKHAVTGREDYRSTEAARGTKRGTRSLGAIECEETGALGKSLEAKIDAEYRFKRKICNEELGFPLFVNVCLKSHGTERSEWVAFISLRYMIMCIDMLSSRDRLDKK